MRGVDLTEDSNRVFGRKTSSGMFLQDPPKVRRLWVSQNSWRISSMFVAKEATVGSVLGECMRGVVGIRL